MKRASCSEKRNQHVSFAQVEEKTEEIRLLLALKLFKELLLLLFVVFLSQEVQKEEKEETQV